MLEFVLMLPVMLGPRDAHDPHQYRDPNGHRESAVCTCAKPFSWPGNGAEYPRREGIVNKLSSVHFNQLVIGISENADPVDSDTTQEQASTYKIVPASVTGYNDAPQMEALQRGNLRVRTSVTLCLPTLVSGSIPLRPTFPLTSDSQQYTMSDNPKQFNFCAAPQVYTDDSGGSETI